MVSAYTPNKNIEQPANGDYPDTWNVPVNADLSIIDKALGSSISKTFSNVDVTLTISEAQNQQIFCTGTLTANVHLIIPFQQGSSTTAVGGEWIVYNNTTGPFVLSVVTQVSGSTGVSIIQGFRAKVYSDTTNVAYSDDPRIFPGQGLTLNAGVMNLIAPVAVSLGGTGNTSYSDGQLLIGNSLTGGLTKATLTAGANISIVNQNGSITISGTSSGGGGVGTVTSVGLSAGSTGLTISASNGNPITTNGTFTLGGTLGVSGGGTGNGSLTGYVKGNGTSPLTGVLQIPGSDITGNITGLSGGITGTLPITQGGTGATTGPAALTALGAGSMATQNSGSVNITGGSISGLSSFSVAGGLSASSFTLSSSGGGAQFSYSGGGGVLNFAFNSSIYGTSSSVTIGAGGATTATWNASQFVSFVAPYTPGGGSWNAYSDRRTKTELYSYTKGLKELKQLRPVSYQYNGSYGIPKDGRTYVGLIAQEVQMTDMKDMVTLTKAPSDDTIELLGINSNELTYALINAVKELSQRVDKLEGQVIALLAR